MGTQPTHPHRGHSSRDRQLMGGLVLVFVIAALCGLTTYLMWEGL